MQITQCFSSKEEGVIECENIAFVGASYASDAKRLFLSAVFLPIKISSFPRNAVLPDRRKRKEEMKKIKTTILCVLLMCALSVNAAVVNFEDVVIEDGEVKMPTPSADGTYSWRSGDFLNLELTSSWGGYAWEGFKYSKASDNSEKNYTNDCCSAMGGGAGGSAQYAVLYAYVLDNSSYTNTYDVMFDNYAQLNSIDVSNTAYTWNSLTNGDGFAPSLYSLTEEGFFKLLIRGIKDEGYTNYEEIILGSRDAEGNVFVLENWETYSFDIFANEALIGLEFSFQSSDNLAKGGYGINTPAYAAIDNISYTVIPEASHYALIFGVASLVLALRKRTQK